jgi:hypothetical protein
VRISGACIVFSPVVFPERFNFFGAAKETALYEGFINGREQFAGLAGITSVSY